MRVREDGTLGVIGVGTYRAIAKLSGLDHRYVSQTLQGKVNPSLRVLEAISKAVGIDMNGLLEYIKVNREESKAA